MGAGADPGVVAVAPVDQVVAAVLAGPRVVGDLVGGRPAAASASPVASIQRGRRVLVGQCERALGVQAEERRAGLDGELVEREMAEPFRREPVELGAPGGDGLPGPGVDQVEG